MVPWSVTKGVVNEVAEVGRMLMRKVAVERASAQKDGGMDA
jgi:hypothetical protein